MAFAVKYQVNFKDVNNVSWIIYFDEDSWGGGITTLTPGTVPIMVTWNQNDKYQSIIGSNADIQLKYESAIDALYTENSQEIRVSAYRDGTLFWQGFLSPGQYYRQFNKPVHMVTLTASDGLGELKEIKFHDIVGDPYFYSQTEALIIANILLKTGISTTFYDAISIYESTYTSTAADSPLAQTYIWPEIYWDNLTGDSANCYDVLSDILKKYGATIRYSYGHWYLLRPNSYSANENILYRVFTTLGNYDSNSSFSSFNSIGSSMFYIHADQEITKLQGCGKAEVTLAPGKRGNSLRNGTFDSFTWNGANPYYWTNSGATYLSSTVTDAITLYTNESASQPTNYLRTDIIKVYSCKSIRLTLDYRCYYQLSPTHVKVCVGLVFGAGSYYEPSTDTWSTTSYAGGTSPVVFDLIAESKSSMTTFETLVIEPSEGPFSVNGEGTYGYGNYLNVWLYELWNETTPGGVNNWLAYSRVTLEIERDGTFPDTQVYTFNAPNTITNIHTAQLNIGDSFIDDVTTQAAGDDDLYLGVTSDAAGGSGNETTEWSIKGHTAAAANISEVLARQLGEGNYKSLDLLRGSIRSAYTLVPHMAFEDSDFKDDYGFNKRFFPRGISYDAHRNEYSGEWVECPVIYTDEEMEWDSHDCGGDATITGNEIEVDSWTNVGGGNFAYFDSYTAVAGETVRLVVNMVDDGASNTPWISIDGTVPPRAFGLNYFTHTFTTAGVKDIEMGSVASSTMNCTVTIDLYSITGV